MRIWLKNIRLSKKIKQKDLAIQSGISQATYCLIEKGERNPTVPTAKKIASVLGFDWTLFFEEVSREELSCKPA